MSFDFSIIEEYTLLILSGIPLILQISLLSAFFGTAIGLLSTFLRRTNVVLKAIVGAYIDVFRGTPVFVQLYFTYFGISGLMGGVNFNKFLICVIVFSLNSGAYLSEIIRAGVDAIDKGQIEAAKALGVDQKSIAKDIIIPQAFRNVLPAVINEFITLTKETAVISVIGLHDMMYYFQAVRSQTYSSFEALLVIFVAYYILNKVLSLIGKFVERKLQYD